MSEVRGRKDFVFKSWLRLFRTFWVVLCRFGWFWVISVVFARFEPVWVASGHFWVKTSFQFLSHILAELACTKKVTQFRFVAQLRPVEPNSWNARSDYWIKSVMRTVEKKKKKSKNTTTMAMILIDRPEKMKKVANFNGLGGEEWTVHWIVCKRGIACSLEGVSVVKNPVCVFFLFRVTLDQPTSRWCVQHWLTLTIFVHSKQISHTFEHKAQHTDKKIAYIFTVLVESLRLFLRIFQQ